MNMETASQPMAWPTDAEQANDSFKVWTTLADPQTMAFGASIYQAQTREYDVPQLWLTWTDFESRSWRQRHNNVPEALLHLAMRQRMFETLGRVDTDVWSDDWMSPIDRYLSTVTDVTKE